MTFVAPVPNCGHGGRSFTWVALASLWMCPLCLASIGALYRVCTHCGHPPKPNTQLVEVYRAGRLCLNCRHHFLAAQRFQF